MAGAGTWVDDRPGLLRPYGRRVNPWHGGPAILATTATTAAGRGVRVHLHDDMQDDLYDDIEDDIED